MTNSRTLFLRGPLAFLRRHPATLDVERGGTVELASCRNRILQGIPVEDLRPVAVDRRVTTTVEVDQSDRRGDRGNLVGSQGRNHRPDDRGFFALADLR